MISKDDDPSPPERDRTANRRWLIGIVLSLVFGIFGAVMALLSYMDRDRQTTIDRTRNSPPAAPAAPSADPAPARDGKGTMGKGHDKK